jgi:RNA polymerase sigma factor FliA
MRIFSGRYPQDLAKVVDHARRMKDLLEDLERVRTEAWFFGRAGELRGVVTLAVTDWRRGATDTETARRAILSHVDHLHRGAARRLRCGLTLACCHADEVITAPGEDDEPLADTEITGPTHPTHGPTAPTGWVDPPETLALVREGRKLIEVHARSLARRLGPGSPTLDDLRECGEEALLIAARAYDERRDPNFERWASVRIRNGIVDGMRSWRSPRGRAKGMLRELVSGWEKCPSHGQETRAHDIEEASGGAFPGGTAGPAAGLVERLQASCASPEELVAKAQLESTVRTLVAQLPGRERALIKRMYFEGQTLLDAAASMGVTRAWARRVHEQAIAKIQGGLQQPRPVGSGRGRARKRL